MLQRLDCRRLNGLWRQAFTFRGGKEMADQIAYIVQSLAQRWQANWHDV